tara:strand:+ start:1293 stop:1940 length:648 start_codon:yes stop_codon:yes gene_type:complete
MKLNSDSFVLILFILGMVYISCDQNIEGLCYGGEECIDLDDETKCRKQLRDKSGNKCNWLEDSPNPTPPPPAPTPSPPTPPSPTGETCHIHAKMEVGGGHLLVTDSSAVHATGCKTGRDTCLHENCTNNPKGCTIKDNGINGSHFPCIINGQEDECYCVPRLYPCVRDHLDCNNHGTGGDSQHGCTCADGWRGTCCTEPPPEDSPTEDSPTEDRL